MKKAFPLALLLATASLFTSFVRAQTVVCVETNLDTFCMQMENDNSVAAANFLRYVDKGAYDNTFIHRSVRSGYLEGGSWQASSFDPVPVVADAPVPNNFTIANTPNKVALVSAPGQPGLATTAWRINVADNSAIFTQANSGAVFADVLANPVNGDGMDVVKRLAKLTTYKIPTATGFLDQAPLLQLDNKITPDDVVQVKSMYRYPGTYNDFQANGIIPRPDIKDVTCMQTNLGDLCFQLYADSTINMEGAPKTVANFLQYVNAGDYDNTFFHRYEAGFVLQGGGFRYDSTKNVVTPIIERAPVVNEYSTSRPNSYATIAMAKIGPTYPDGSANPFGGPDTATNQWFINMGDNTSGLGPANNGGFTTFGALIPSSFTSLIAITNAASTVTQDVSVLLNNGALTEVPFIKIDTPLNAGDFITVQKAYQTQRDVSYSAAGITRLPLDSVVAMTTVTTQFTGFGARFPVRIDNNLYMIILTTHSSTTIEDNDPGFSDGRTKYDLDTSRIYQLIENGRVAATYDDQAQTITIPSVRIADQIFINVVLKKINSPETDATQRVPYIFELQDGFEQM